MFMRLLGMLMGQIGDNYGSFSVIFSTKKHPSAFLLLGAFCFQALYFQGFGDGRPGGGRTRDLQIRNLSLCPTELLA